MEVRRWKPPCMQVESLLPWKKMGVHLLSWKLVDAFMGVYAGVQGRTIKSQVGWKLEGARACVHHCLWYSPQPYSCVNYVALSPTRVSNIFRVFSFCYCGRRTRLIISVFCFTQQRQKMRFYRLPGRLPPHTTGCEMNTVNRARVGYRHNLSPRANLSTELFISWNVEPITEAESCRYFSSMVKFSSIHWWTGNSFVWVSFNQ